jgi:hypothetical protein
MRNDLSEHYRCVQKGLENHIRVKVPDPNKAHLIFVFKYRLVKTSKNF